MQPSLESVAQELGLRSGCKSQQRRDFYCPVHDQDTPDLSIYTNQHTRGPGFACHGKGGESPVTLVIHCRDCSKEAAVDWLQEQFPDQFGNMDQETVSRRQAAREVLQTATDLAHDTLKKQRTDLLEEIKGRRDFGEDTIKAARIGFLSREDTELIQDRFDEQALTDSGLFGESEDGLYCHLSNRIVFPYLQHGQPVFMVGRRLPDSSSAAKYKKTRTTDYNRHCLYQFTGNSPDQVIITEGVTDAISVMQAGYDVVSPVTTQFRDQDIEDVVAAVNQYDSVYIAMDGDSSGRDGARDTAKALTEAGVEPHIVDLKDGQDLDDWTTANGYGLDELLEEARPYIDTVLDRLTRAGRRETAELKAHVFELIEDWSEIERNAVLEELPGGINRAKSEFKDWKEHCDHDTDTDEHQDTESVADRYPDHIVAQAEDVLESQHILKLVKTVLDHKIAGEDKNKMGLFLSALSKDTDDPLMVFGVQKQGEGKSYIAKNVLDLFPDHMVVDVTDMTKAALFRRAQDDPRYFDGKIVFFGEIPEQEEDRSIFQIFRQLVSEGEVSKELVIEQGSELKAKRLELKGSPVVISTTVNEDVIDEQDMSRGLAYSPTMGKEQNRRVREYQNSERELPDHVVSPEEVEELERVLTCALDLLAQGDVSLQNPFTREFDEHIPDNIPNVKRDYPKAVQIASELPAYLYHRQRPKREIKDTEYTYVSWKDVARGLVITQPFINAMIRGRTESTMDAYEVVSDEVEAVHESYEDMEGMSQDRREDFGSFTSLDLVSWMGVNAQTARTYLRQLDRMGLIFKDSSGRPHRHYLLKDEHDEVGGITLGTLQTIIESVFDGEAVRDWVKDYIDFLDEERVGDIGEAVTFQEKDLPIELDLGMTPSPSFPTPVYMENTEYKIKASKALNISKEGANIICDFESVIPEASNTGDESDKKELSSEPVEEIPEQSVTDLIDYLDDGEGVTYQDLISKSSRSEPEIENRIDTLREEGEVFEPKPGRVKVT